MPTNHKNTFSPVATQTATFQHTLVAGAVTGNLLCDAPSSANLITGRTNGSDFIEYETSGDLNIRTNLVLIA
jgi:microcystin degradation protein MlrC